MIKSAHNRTRGTEAMKMYDFSKTFFSSKRADAFKAELLALGIEAVIVSERDYLNAAGTLYYLKWNKD